MIYRTFREYKSNLLSAICYFSNFLINYDDCDTVGTFGSGKLDNTLGKAEYVSFDMLCEDREGALRNRLNHLPERFRLGVVEQNLFSVQNAAISSCLEQPAQ